MPKISARSRIYDLYLSHSWNYNEAYKNLTYLLDHTKDFPYRTPFVPKDIQAPAKADERALYESIRNRLKHCDALIIMCGVYSAYSRWVNKEIIICKEELAKPIIAVQPFAPEKTSLIVRSHADRIVDWDLRSIVNAIKELV